MRHVTHMKESCHTYEWVMSHIFTVCCHTPLFTYVIFTHCVHVMFDVWYDSFIRVTWLIRMCDMTHSYVWHDSFRCVTWLIYKCNMAHSYVWHELIHLFDMNSFICVTWLIQMCDMTQSYVWHASFICMTWTHLYVWHELIHMCDMNSFICVTCLVIRCRSLCKRALQKWLYSAKETYDFKEPTYVWHASSYAVTRMNESCIYMYNTIYEYKYI